MNKKKIFMILLLIIFIGALVMTLILINNKSTQKMKDTSKNGINNSKTNTSINKKKTEIQRKIKEKPTVDLNNMIEITDNFFIEQITDLSINLEDYIGKTIKIEGLIYSYEDYNGDICYAVVRNTPGCCGSDGLAGLDIRYFEDYPSEDTWVEIIGVVGTDVVFGSKIPAIHVETMNVKEAGVTFVTN